MYSLKSKILSKIRTPPVNFVISIEIYVNCDCASRIILQLNCVSIFKVWVDTRWENLCRGKTTPVKYWICRTIEVWGIMLCRDECLIRKIWSGKNYSRLEEAWGWAKAKINILIFRKDSWTMSWYWEAKESSILSCFEKRGI